MLNTVVDALELGFGVVLLTEAMRGINLQAGDEEAALATMTGYGAVPGPGVLMSAARQAPAPQRHP